MACGRRLWIVLPLLLTVAMTGAGCGDDGQEQRGPSGSVGPVGPIGPVGDDQGIPGSGTIVIVTPDVSGFDQVVFKSEGAVTVTEGSDESLEIETDDNLVEYLESAEVDGVLEITTRDGVDIAPTQPPAYRIVMPHVAGIDLAGAGSITMDGVDTASFSVGLSGAGEVKVRAVQVTELTVDLQGVGSVTLTGIADRADVAVGGVVVFDGSDLLLRDATVAASGTGHATVWVTENLDAEASDSAEITYYGQPSVTTATSELGTVMPLGDK